MADNVVAYGFIGLKHLFAQRIEDVGIPKVYRAIQDTAAEYNRQMNEIMRTLATKTVKGKERIYIPALGTLQPLDEWGNPKPTRGGAYYDVAYPLQGGGDAFGTNRVSRQLMTVEEVNRETMRILTNDANWVRRHALAALFDNAAWSYDDDKLGALTIQPLAIASDGVKYVKAGGALATDEHYYAQADGIDNTHNPFPAIYNELSEHPGNGRRIVVYLASNLRESVEALSGFVEVNDPDILPGANTDTIAASIGDVRRMGDDVLGKVDKCWVVEWKALPDNYFLATALDGEPPLKMREYDSRPLQGLFTEGFSPDGNLNEVRMIRYAGFGVGNRTGALCGRIGSATYAPPGEYDAPLAV